MHALELEESCFELFWVTFSRVLPQRYGRTMVGNGHGGRRGGTHWHSGWLKSEALLQAWEAEIGRAVARTHDYTCDACMSIADCMNRIGYISLRTLRESHGYDGDEWSSM